MISIFYFTQNMSSELSQTFPPKLLNQVVARLFIKHYSLRTQKSYVDWIKRYIWHHGKCHPLEICSLGVGGFLSHLAVPRNVSASWQNQAKKCFFVFV